ncbi:MAG: copper resistance protein [Levilactobacillus sp.]|uniref:Copper homeostasis protein cutC homolog n=1 Tax=Levilactobacillus suantsaiihabitans TaxID=2487722 RepID=A0A4Z0J8W0_9LACO|nr:MULTISPECIES: copper homeostasis protein CutC [Levilactobacillus]MCH4123104.1 copper resistance protein [Levilactobacillus sp.]MCI1552758.1 copper resistance protein [Levilactobacillus sp.]MCI1599584.1 copper resistance protein [Levilactobacillus sp.]MCI1606727.1 copper resistance protein [Levilactobacillus sp.]TGD18163.1 copper resistance protein [Levilactobacillus suantsaiihabitans]
MLLVEPLLENYTDLPAAIRAGAKRVALADNLAVGGTTVSKGVMAEAVRYAHEHQVTLELVIAPRGGIAPYNGVEIKMMEADLLEAQQLGVDGAILSGLTAQHQLDVEVLSTLIAAAGGMTLTFGTAFDHIRPQDRGTAMDWLASQGVDHVLSTGSASDDRIADWTASKRLADADGLTLIPANVTAADASDVADKLGVNLVYGPAVLTLD